MKDFTQISHVIKLLSDDIYIGKVCHECNLKLEWLTEENNRDAVILVLLSLLLVVVVYFSMARKLFLFCFVLFVDKRIF